MFETIKRFGQNSPWAPWILFLLSLLLILPTLGRSELRDWDEAIYASVSREIYRTGDFLSLKFNESPYMKKPPLYMILTAGAYSIFGINEFSARFTSGLFGIGCILLGYILIKRLFNRGDAFISGLFLLANYHFLGITQHGRMESMVAFFILLCCYFLIKCRENGWWIIPFFVSLSLGTLTKGPTGMIPLAIALLYIPFDREIRINIRLKHLSAGIALFTLFTAPWFYFQFLLYNREYINSFLGYEIIARIVKPIEGHKGYPFYYMRAVSFSYFSSWAFLIPISVIYIAWETIKSRSIEDSLTSGESLMRQQRKNLLLITIYIGVFIAVLELMQSKLHWYAYSLYVPLAYSVVMLLTRLHGRLTLVKEFIIAATIISIVVFNFAILSKKPVFAHKELSPVLKSALKPGESIIAYNMSPASLYFYADRKIEFAGDEKSFLKNMDTHGKLFILNEGDFQKLTKDRAVEIIAQIERHVVFRAEPLQK